MFVNDASSRPDRPGRPAPRRHPGGYSLIELLVTLVVIGISSGVALPQFLRALQAEQLRAATLQIFTDLQLTHALAISTQDPHEFQLWPDGTYSIINARDNLPVLGKDRAALPPLGALLTDEVDSRFTFDPLGTAETGTVTLQGLYETSDGEPGQSVVRIYRSGLVRIEG